MSTCKLLTYSIIVTFLILPSLINSQKEELPSTAEGPLTLEENEEIYGLYLKFTHKFEKLSTSFHPAKFLKISKADDHKDSLICKTCLWTFGHIHDFLMKKYGLKGFFWFLSLICSTVLEKDVCNSYINSYAPIIYDSLVDHYLNKEIICTLSHLCQTSHFIVLEADDYAKELLKDKVEKVRPAIDTEAPVWKVVHIGDFHVDKLYKEGSLGKCAAIICCRESNEDDVSTNEEKAGMFGYMGNCDIPMRTLESFVNYTVNEVNPDFIIWTGDNPAHDPWTGTQADVFNVTSLFTELLTQTYNYTRPVYPTIGNHEIYPNDEYSPFTTHQTYIFQDLADTFRGWLDDQAYETFAKFGFYSQKHPNSNLRIISTNCLLCDSFDFYLFKNPTDPFDQVKWLEDTLRRAEEDEEVVYLISHIPIGESFFYNVCAKRFQALIDRFSYIIRGTFFAHTHYDEVKIMHGYFNYTQITAATLIAPSLTTYPFKNPSFRLLEIDSNTKIPRDYLQYSLNLEQSNLKQEAIWEVRYKATDLFNVTYLNDTEKIYEYTLNIETDQQVFESALRAYVTNSPKYQDYVEIKGMAKYLSCRFKESTFGDLLKCVHYRTKFADEYIIEIMNLLAGKWFEELPN